MRKQITFKQYKAIDIALLSVLHFAFEAMVIYVTINFFPLQDVALSITPLIVIIMMMRWGWFAAISAVVGGLAYCVAGGASPEQYLIYCLGNLFGILAMLIISKWGKEEVRKKPAKLITVAVSTYLFMNIGRWLVSLIFEPTIKTLLVFITTDIISLLLAIIGVLAVRKTDGMIEDQKSYLLRLDREAKEEAEAKRNETQYFYGNEDDDEYDEFDDIVDEYDEPDAEESDIPNENNDELI